MEQEEYIIENPGNSSDITENLLTSLRMLSINETPPSENPVTNISEYNIQDLSTASLLPVRKIPCHNVPEKIMICLDTCADPEFTAFKIGDGLGYSPLYMLKRTIEIFVKNKHFIDCQHQFALLTCNETSVNWVQKFTNNPRHIINSLSDITVCEQQEQFDLSLLLESIRQNVTIPKTNKDLSITPPFVVRLILLYNRSCCTPIMDNRFKKLLTNPYFIIDVVMTHEESQIDDKYEDIFNTLQEMDTKGLSYNFDVGRNPIALHDAMAKLLSHPLQRPQQQYALYKAFLPDEEE